MQGAGMEGRPLAEIQLNQGRLWPHLPVAGMLELLSPVVRTLGLRDQFRTSVLPGVSLWIKQTPVAGRLSSCLADVCEVFPDGQRIGRLSSCESCIFPTRFQF